MLWLWRASLQTNDGMPTVAAPGAIGSLPAIGFPVSVYSEYPCITERVADKSLMERAIG